MVNMKGLLAMAAVDAFAANPDAIFSHSKNFYFADYLSGAPRLHFPWDLDSALGGGANSNVYAQQSPYSDILLDVPQFRAQYSQILNDLVCGPLAASQIHEFLDALEPVLSAALAADPNSQIEDPIDEFFDERRTWFAQRVANVTSQIEGFQACSYDCGDGVDNDGDGKTDFAGGDLGCFSASDASERSVTTACDDGQDNDGDGFGDFGDDPGCRAPSADNESPQCQDGLNNDGQAGIDFDGGASVNGGVPIAAPDPQCTAAWRNKEASTGCGIGFELALVLPALAAWRRRIRAGRG
jgi:hypothetical protein